MRRPRGIGVRAKVGGLVATEERQQATITVLFVGTIIAVALILLGAVALGWYNDNLRPLGKVGSTEIAPQLLRDKVRLEQFRIARDESRITEAAIAGTLDTETANAKKSALQSRTQSLTSDALNQLVDTIYQAQLAPDSGITVSDADVDARYQQEISTPEQRHVWTVSIAPQVADESTGATAAERQAALDKANQALADLNAGKDFAEVARTYGTDPHSLAGGDMGNITQLAAADDTFGEALFTLPLNGTTPVIRGDDGTYRIGRVTEITPGSIDGSLKSKLLGDMSEQEARQLIGYEAAADALHQKVVNDALGASPEQERLAVIYVEGLFSGDEAAKEGEVDYSQIVFAPGDNPETAADLDPNDPAWAAAKTEADNTFAQLQAITDPEERKSKFEEIATNNSDDATSQDGGAVGFTTRDVAPTAIGDALWTGDHAKGDLIGPIKGDDGYYVIMFNEKRASPEDRVQQVKDALAQPNADFAALAKQYSDGPEAADGGEIGWLTKDALSTDIVDKVWNLTPGQVSEPVELGQGHYFIKVEEKAVRPLDADQQATVRQSAFDTWYQPKKDDAIANGTITTVEPLSSGGDLSGGGDQSTP